MSDAVAVLSRTPQTLRSLLDGLPASWSEASEGAGTWSPTQVVAHLLLADRTNWIPRARIFLADGPRELPRIDPDAQVRSTGRVTLAELLADFGRVRAENLAELASWQLTDTQLQRTAAHPEFGTVVLTQLLSTWTAHDLSHLAQIARVMASQYRDAVGPWSAYLRVMRR